MNRADYMLREERLYDTVSGELMELSRNDPVIRNFFDCYLSGVIETPQAMLVQLAVEQAKGQKRLTERMIELHNLMPAPQIIQKETP